MTRIGRPKRSKRVRMDDKAGEAWLRTSIPQAVLLRLLDTSRQVLAEHEAAGMPRRADGRYDAATVIAWLKDRWKRSAKATPAESGDAMTQQQYDALRAKYRALEQRQKFLEQGGKLISREDAEDRYLKIVLQIRAALSALPGVVAPQLVNQPIEILEKALTDRIHWLLHQFEDGWIPLPEWVGKAIDEMVARVRAEAPNLSADQKVSDA